MVKFYATVGGLRTTEKGLAVLRRGKECLLTKHESIMWAVLVNKIYEEHELERKFESTAKVHNVYEEDAFPKTLNSLMEKGIIVSGEGKNTKAALYNLVNNLDQETMVSLVLRKMIRDSNEAAHGSGKYYTYEEVFGEDNDN